MVIQQDLIIAVLILLLGMVICTAVIGYLLGDVVHQLMTTNGWLSDIAEELDDLDDEKTKEWPVKKQSDVS